MLWLEAQLSERESRSLNGLEGAISTAMKMLVAAHWESAKGKEQNRAMSMLLQV